MKLSEKNGAVSQSNLRNPLALAPATTSINSPQSGNFANAGPGSKCLDIRDITQNLEFHEIIVSKPAACVNGAPLLRRGLRVARLLGRRRRREEDEHVGDDDGRHQEIEGGEQPIVVRDHAADQWADARAER